MAREKRQRGYSRDSVEFGRVVAFSDGLFAIAMTLLVVTITVPAVDDAASVGDLAEGLGDQASNVISFFISFAVIGRYWVAHHNFFALLKGLVPGFIGLNLLYLAFIALLPFPTELLGTYFENPLAVSIYAVSVGIVSALEVVLIRYARRNDLLQRRWPDDVYRYALTMSLIPVAMFAISIPVAFANTTAAVCTWWLSIPVSAYVDRRKPDRTDEYLGP